MSGFGRTRGATPAGAHAAAAPDALVAGANPPGAPNACGGPDSRDAHGTHGLEHHRSLPARARALSVTAVALALAPLPAIAELPVRPVLPLELAQRMVNACVDLARDEGWPIAVAVKDTGGHLLAFARLENASTATVDGALSKAATSAATPVPTRMLADIAFSGEGGAPTAVAFLPNVALFAGGLPVRSGAGQPVGAIGVSGVTPDQDEQCAQAGIDAVADALD